MVRSNFLKRFPLFGIPSAHFEIYQPIIVTLVPQRVSGLYKLRMLLLLYAFCISASYPKFDSPISGGFVQCYFADREHTFRPSNSIYPLSGIRQTSIRQVLGDRTFLTMVPNLYLVARKLVNLASGLSSGLTTVAGITTRPSLSLAFTQLSKVMALIFTQLEPTAERTSRTFSSLIRASVMSSQKIASPIHRLPRRKRLRLHQRAVLIQQLK